MKIQSTSYYPTGKSAPVKENNKAPEEKKATETPKTDQVSISKDFHKREKVESKGNESLVKALREDMTKRTEEFHRLIMSLVTKQSDKAKNVLSSMNLDFNSSNTKAVQSQEALDAAYGEHSAEKVAGRLIDMAKSLSGGDKSKIPMLRDAVEKGFGAAANALGMGSRKGLPDVCQKTYDLVMKRFDDWEKGVE